MSPTADFASARHRVAVIEVDAGDPCPSTLFVPLDEALEFVSSDTSPAGYRWHELHVAKGLLERESLIVASALEHLVQAHANGLLTDFRIVEGALYLERADHARADGDGASLAM